MAVSFRTSMVRTLPHDVVISLIRPNVKYGGRFEIITLQPLGFDAAATGIGSVDVEGGGPAWCGL